MANTQLDRRRKRSFISSPREEKSSWTSIAVILTAGLILSLLISLFDEAEESRLSDGRRKLSVGGGGDLGYADRQRRVLTVDVGEENVWRRQLRARKKRDRILKQVGGEAGWEGEIAARTRSMAADMEGEDVAVMGEVDGQPTRRMAVIPRYTDKHHFHECTGKSIPQCQALVDAYVQAHPEQFNNQTTLLLDIRKIRELTDESYYKVVLRTNLPGTKVYGIFDDGMVYYPWPWRVNGVDNTIGPWSCEESGNILSPLDCCAKIQEDVKEMDDNGNYLACFVEEPVGGPNNPERDDRAIVVTDARGKVVRAPVAH